MALDSDIKQAPNLVSLPTICTCIAATFQGEQIQDRQVMLAIVAVSELFMKMAAGEVAMLTCYRCWSLFPENCYHVFDNCLCKNNPEVCEKVQPYLWQFHMLHTQAATSPWPQIIDSNNWDKLGSNCKKGPFCWPPFLKRKLQSVAAGQTHENAGQI